MEKDVREGNKMIAEFMGKYFAAGRVYHDEQEFKNMPQDFIRELKYHTSWDWLMPVVKKILATDTGTLDVYSLYVEDSLRTADILKVWESCIDFIEYYNSTTQLTDKK